MAIKLESMRTQSSTEIAKESDKLRQKLAGLRKDLLVNDVKENSQIRKVRKDIARLETLKREKESKDAEVDKS